MIFVTHSFHCGKFPPGRIAITSGAYAAVTPDYLTDCLARHVAGDWGDISPLEEFNDAALATGAGSVLISSYPVDPANPFDYADRITLWVITDLLRGETHLLRRDEYAGPGRLTCTEAKEGRP